MAWKPPPGWTTTRKKVLAAKGRACWWCGAWANTVDHVRPLALGGSDDMSNLVPACARCNYSRGARLGNQLRENRRVATVPRPWFTSRNW
jgi:5-methylcytosine-specific restriction endonuclease McrA